MENIDKATIKDNLNLKPDSDLLEILVKNNIDEWQDEVFGNIAGALIFYAVWYSYLNMSKRVKAIFPSNSRETKIYKKTEEL